MNNLVTKIAKPKIKNIIKKEVENQIRKFKYSIKDSVI